MSWLSGKDAPDIINNVYQQNKPKRTNPNDAVVAQKVSEIYTRYPSMPAGVVLSLAEGNAEMDMIDVVAQQSAKAAAAKRVKEIETRPEYGYFGRYSPVSLVGQATDGVWAGAKWILGNTVGRAGVIKDIVKGASATLDTTAQVAQNLASGAYSEGEASELLDPRSRNFLNPAGVKDFFESTSVGALTSGDDSGSGFFLSGEAEVNRAEAARRVRGEINGHTWTIGRGAASVVSTPGTKPYMFLSGLMDATVSLATDPTSYIGPSKAARLAAKEIPALRTAEEIAVAAKLAAGHAGLLSTAEQHVINTSAFFQFMDGSQDGGRVLKALVDETNELKILEGMGYKISPEQARTLAGIVDRDVMRGTLAGYATRLTEETTQGFVPFATRAKELPYSMVERTPAKRLLNDSRWLTQKPEEMILINGTAQDRGKAVKNMVNWVKTMKLDPYEGDGKKVMDATFEAFVNDGTKVDAKKLHRLMVGDIDRGEEGIVSIALKAQGVKQEIIDDVLAEYIDTMEKLRAYAMDETGVVNDGGFVRELLKTMTPDKVYELKKFFLEPQLVKLGPNPTQAAVDALVDGMDDDALSLFGPAALTDLVNNVMVLPDARRVRSLITDNPFMNLNKGKQGASIIAEVFQNDIWKPYALSTFGFMMRNTMDAQLRIALDGTLRHPIDYIMVAMRRSGLGTLGPQGARFKDVDDEFNAANELFEYVNSVKNSVYKWVGRPEDNLRRLIKNKGVDIVSTDQPAYTLALNERLRRVYASPELRLLVQTAHLPADRQVKIISKFLESGTEEANGILRTLQRYAEDGYKVGVPRTGRRPQILKFENWKDLTTEEIVSLWYEHLGKSQIDNLVFQGNDGLKVMAGHGHVPVGPYEWLDEATARSRTLDGKRPKVGDILTENGYTSKGLPKVNKWVVYETEDAPGIGRQFKAMPVEDVGNAFAGDDGTKLAQRYLQQQLEDHGTSLMEGRGATLPNQLIMGQRVTKSDLSLRQQGWVTAMGIYQKPAQWFFNTLVPKGVEMAERSPVWRMSYYGQFADNASLLSPTEAQELLVDIERHAQAAISNHYVRDAEGAMARYVGGKNTLDKIRASVAQAVAGDGVGTRQQLQTYAATMASQKVQELLFDASDQSNLEDALRIIAPFGAAWREVFSNYGKMLVEDPRKIRRAQQVFRGLSNFDPDQDGRGLIWQDPISKVPMVGFPASSLMIQAVTTLTSAAGYGVPIKGAQINAPAKQLSAGLQVVPGVGPVASFAYGFFADKIESLDQNFLRKLIQPYGQPTLKSVSLPGYMIKLNSALFDDPKMMGTLYQGVQHDTFNYLATTGEYNLKDKNDVERLFEDSSETARVLTFLRAASQFIGPTSGKVEFKADLEKGDVYVNSLVGAWHDLQQENYDTAVGEFIKIFGEDALIYMGAKTKANPDYDGLEATSIFGEWEKKNAGLLETYKMTAAYLAPMGDDFSFETWNRQINGLKRFRQSPKDALLDAQKKIGSYYYRDFRKKYPPNPDADERAEIKDKRKELHDKYPGFPLKAEFEVGKFPNFIEQLRDLEKDKRVKGNPVMATITQYLDKRDVYLEDLERDNLDGTSDEIMSAKDDLYRYGNSLAEQNPDFSRIWQRKLIQEVEE